MERHRVVRGYGLVNTVQTIRRREREQRGRVDVGGPSPFNRVDLAPGVECLSVSLSGCGLVMCLWVFMGGSGGRERLTREGLVRAGGMVSPLPCIHRASGSAEFS
jgi:hypothetical protein